MESRGLKIAGGVIEIVAGAFWLVMSLFVYKIGQVLGYNLDTIQIIMPMVFIFFGIMACTKKPKKQDFTTYGILNMVFVALQFYYGNYVGLGIVQMVLLFIAGMLFFFVKSTQAEIEYKKGFKEFVKKQPTKVNITKIILYIATFAIILITNAIIMNYALEKPIVKLPFDMPGFPLLICLGVFVIVSIIFVVLNKNFKIYKISQNIIWNAIAVIPTFFLNLMFFYKIPASQQQIINGLTGETTILSTTPASSNGIELGILGIALYIFIALITYRTQLKVDYDNYLALTKLQETK